MGSPRCGVWWTSAGRCCARVAPDDGGGADGAGAGIGGGERGVGGQEVGTLTYLVHDAVTAAGTTVLSFNAHQLRMIAASRKRTDRRDAYWIAKALQSGMYPHPVYIPTGEIRELRAVLSRRRALKAEDNRWRYRGRAYVRAAGRSLTWPRVLSAPREPGAGGRGSEFGRYDNSPPVIVPTGMSLAAHRGRAHRLASLL